MDLTAMFEGLLIVIQPANILWIAIGCIMGMFAGTLPGINDITMVSVLLPLVYKIPVEQMILAIVGIYAASCYAGSTAGILYNIPGNASAIPTTIEGYRLTLKGRTVDALATACGSSFFGNTFGVLAMVVLLPTFQYFITFFGSAEKALLGILAVVLICTGVLTRDDPFKGLGSMGLGLLIACVGTQGNVGVIRYALKVPNLWDGFNIIWIALGLFAVPQLLNLPSMKSTLEKATRSESGKARIESPKVFYTQIFTSMKKNFGMMVRGSIIGTIVGIIPGIGPNTAAWLAYSNAQSGAKNPEEIGDGSTEAIACIESSNNSCLPGALIPMFALGIPGSTICAIIMGIFILAGFSPGPQMMQTNGPLVWAIAFGVLVAGAAFLMVAYIFRLAAGSLLALPVHWTLVVLGPLVMVGTYIAKNDIFGSQVVLIVTLLALLLNYLRVPNIGLILGVILGGMIETETVRALQVGGIGRFLRPFPMILILFNLYIFFYSVYKNYFSKSSKQSSAPKAKGLRMVGQTGDEELIEDESGNLVSVKIDPERLKNKDRFQRLLFGVLLVMLSAWGFPQTSTFGPVASIWPRFLFIVFIFPTAVVLLISAAVDFRRVAGYIKEKTSVKMNKVEKRRLLDKFVIYFSIAACVALIPVLGMVLSCAVFALFVTLFMTGWKPLSGFSAFLIVIAFMLVLKLVVGLPLPPGPLGF